MARNTGRVIRVHKGRGDKEHNATIRGRQGTGPSVKSSRGGGAGVCVVEVGRERKGPLDGRTLGPKGTLFRRSRMAKVGETDEVRQT